jgi:hypothetical protein
VTAIPATIAAAAVALGSLAAACGGSSDANGIAHLGSTTSTTGQSSSGGPMAQALEFAACMRNHGGTDFPDPKTSGTGKVTSRMPDSPQAKAAQKACRHLLPNGGSPDTSEQTKERTFLLKYAACMRRHGITKFPDPNSQGRFPEHPAGFDPRSPSFEAARTACQPLAGGFVNTRP